MIIFERKWAPQKKNNGRMMGAPPIIFFLRKWAPQKKKMGSAHFLAVQFLGAHDPYIPIGRSCWVNWVKYRNG